MPQFKTIPFLLALLATQALWAADTTKVYYVGLPGEVSLYSKPISKWRYEKDILSTKHPVYLMEMDTVVPVDTFKLHDTINLIGPWVKVRTEYDTGYVMMQLLLPFKMYAYYTDYLYHKDPCAPEELSYFERVFGLHDSTLKNVIPFGNAKEYFKTKKAVTPYCVKQFSKQLKHGLTFTYYRPDDSEMAPTLFIETDSLNVAQMHCFAETYCGGFGMKELVLGLRVADYLGEFANCYYSKVYQKGTKVVWEFTYYCR